MQFGGQLGAGDTVDSPLPKRVLQELSALRAVCSDLYAVPRNLRSWAWATPQKPLPKRALFSCLL